MNSLHAMDVCYSYSSQEENILQNVSLKLVPGKLIVLLGPNGCGKTTLLKLLAGRLQPDAGKILLNQKELSLYSSRQRVNLISVVPQNIAFCFDYTVSEFVMFGRYSQISPLRSPTSKDLNAVSSSLQKLDLNSLSQRSVLTLSGGEQQRVSIALALAAETPFILLDEPIASLDPVHSVMVINSLKTMSKNHGILLSLHDIYTASQCADQIIMMKQGKIVAEGIPEDVLTEDILSDVYHCHCEISPARNGKRAFFWDL